MKKQPKASRKKKARVERNKEKQQSAEPTVKDPVLEVPSPPKSLFLTTKR